MAPVFGVGLVEAALVLFVLVALPVLVLVSAGAMAGPRVAEPGRVVAARVAGALFGLLAAAWLVQDRYDWLSLGRGPMLAPVGFGIGVLLGVILGETLARPASTTGVRTASLAPRRVRDHAPQALAWVVASLGLAAAAILAFTTVTASADDQGRAGRALTRTCLNAAGFESVNSRTPYPGSFYSVPLALGLLAALLLFAVSARRVVLRPRGTTAGEEGDDVLRRRSVTAVLAALGIAIAAPLVGIAGTAGLALTRHGCSTSWWNWLGVLMLICAAVCIPLLAWFSVRLLVRR